MKVLVTGANGFIGAAIVSELIAQGVEVTGVARNPAQAATYEPRIRWMTGDFNQDRLEDWLPRLAGMDGIVNAVGVLQDGAHDDLTKAHIEGADTLFAACEQAGIRRVIQISAVGATLEASTAFLRTKAEGDARLMARNFDWIILRPGLVLGRAAYGGTALLRANAALPFILPVATSRAKIQVIGVEDVARSVAYCLQPDAPVRLVLDLLHPEHHDVADISKRLRAWLGLGAVPLVHVPDWIMRPICKIGDAVSCLGWRPPIRSTTLDVLKAGVIGDDTKAIKYLPFSFLPLVALPDFFPAFVQERWHARLYLLRGLAIAALALFWLASGAIALLKWPDAAEIITKAGFGGAFSTAFVILTALLDVLISAMIAQKRWHRAGLLLAIVTSIGYLASASIILPGLWLDPLGPLVKVLPQIMLAAMLLAMADER